MDIGSREDLLKFALDSRTVDGLHLEFGVADGDSLTWLRRLLPSHVPLYGFDSFKGLHEEWNGNPIGTFATKQRIDLPNTHLIEGMFEDTLKNFLYVHPEPCAFINIDCDLYSSTRHVLFTLNDRIVPGTIIHFDELYNYPGWEHDGEYRALQEYCLTFGRSYSELITMSPDKAVIRVE